MTDKFRDAVSELSERTARTLDEVSEKVYEAGLLEPSNTLNSLSEQHKKMVHNCLVETQPIDAIRYDLNRRFRNDIEELRELAADLLSRGKPGHDQISEAAELLEEALGLQQ